MHNLDFFYKNIYLYKKIPSFISYIESEVNHLTYERTSFKFKDRNCILDTLIKIDQAQKEAIMEKECDTCERSLLQKIFNTRPAIFYLCDGKPFKVEVPGEPQDTIFFRVEEIRNDCVLLRILVKKGPTWDCRLHGIVKH